MFGDRWVGHSVNFQKNCQNLFKMSSNTLIQLCQIWFDDLPILVGTLFMGLFLTPESILYLYKSTIRPCMEYCSHILGGSPRPHGINLLDRVQNRVVSLVCSVFSANLQACHTGGMLLASACSTSITMGKVPLSLQISYLPNVSLLEADASSYS